MLSLRLNFSTQAKIGIIRFSSDLGLTNICVVDTFNMVSINQCFIKMNVCSKLLVVVTVVTIAKSSQTTVIRAIFNRLAI